MRLIKKFSTLNFNNVYFLNKLIRKKEKKNSKRLKYLSKYLYALDNSLDFEYENKYNNPIWQLWLQGEDNMPDIVKFCTKSIKVNNPERDIILLTNKNLNEYIAVPDYIQKKYAAGIISHTHYSDLIRLFLLCKYGGTWIDSTIYMTGRMPEHILKSDFFVFKDLTSSLINTETTLEQFVILNNKLNFGAWTNSISFIHSTKNNNILNDTLKIMLEYWRHENKAIDYLFFSYILTLVIFQNKEYKEEFINMPYKLTTVEYGALQCCLYEHFDQKLYEQILALTPIHKLIYKHQDKNIYKDSFFNYFVSQIKDS